MKSFKYIEKHLQNVAMIAKDTAVAILSDLHLGVRDNKDNSLQNELLILQALKYYYENNFLVVLLGDTFEVAEKNDIEEIKIAHNDIMEMLEKLYSEKRLIIVRGNHEALLTPKQLFTRFDPQSKKTEKFLTDLQIYESVKIEGTNIEMFHGHENSFVYCSKLNNFVIWLLRHIWTPLEYFAFKDITKEELGFTKISKNEEFFIRYSTSNKKRVITGHTHSVRFFKDFYNVGAGVMPRSVTTIEIVNDVIKNFRWRKTVTDDGTLKIQKVNLN